MRLCFPGACCLDESCGRLMYEPAWKHPSSVEEALYDLADAGKSVKVIAGGTDLAIQLKKGESRPDVLVDMGRVDELRPIDDRRGDPAGPSLEIGALATHGALAGSEIIRESLPLLADACRTVGAPQIRARATVGGNLANGSPAADAAVALLALDAVTVLESNGEKRTSREVPAGEFLTGPGRTVLRDAELLTRVRVDVPAGSSRAVYIKAGQRNALAIAIVSVAAVFDPETGSVRIALGSVAPMPVRASGAESLFGEEWNGCSSPEELIEAVAVEAVRSASPISDVRASAEYRTILVEALTRRALKEICL